MLSQAAIDDDGIIRSCKWRIASHVCGFSVQWAPIGRERVKRIAAAARWNRLPRMGYQREVQIAGRSYYVTNRGGRFEIARNPLGDVR